MTAVGQTIDRRRLGALVFGKPDQLKRLTDIVWPEIKRLALQEISFASRTVVLGI